MSQTALYVRMSTDKQEHSAENQIQVLTEYAKRHKMYISKTYADEGISGRNAEKRPAFMEMIADSSKDLFESVLIYDSSRFARNLKESLIYKSILQQNGVKLISITEPNVDDETSILTDAMLGAMNEMYSLKLAKNVRRGMEHNAAKGGYQSSPPYGYKILIKKEPPSIVEKEAAVVRKMFDLFINGTHCFGIARQLNEIGYRTRRGGKWERRSIEYILRNPAYKGMTVWNKRKTGKTAYNDVADWIIVPGKHEPIVSPKIFDKAQTIFALTDTPINANRRPPQEYSHWLSGMLKCSKCNGTLTFSRTTPTQGSFSCNNYKKGKCMTSNSISKKKAEIAIFNILDNNFNPGSIKKSDITIISDTPKDIENIDAQLLKLDKRLIRIREAYESGVDSLEEYKHRKDELTKEYDSLILKRENLNKQEIDIDINALVEKFSSVSEMLKSATHDNATKNTALRNVISHITYDRNDGILRTHFVYRL